MDFNVEYTVFEDPLRSCDKPYLSNKLLRTAVE